MWVYKKKKVDIPEFSLGIFPPSRDDWKELCKFWGSPTRFDVLNSVSNSIWFSNIIKYMQDVIQDDMELNSLWESDVSLSLLIFYVFYYKEPLLIVQDKKTKKIDIYHIDAFNNLLCKNWCVWMSVSNVLWVVRNVFEEKEEFRKIVEMSSFPSLDLCKKIFNDLMAIQIVDEDFKNCRFEWKITNWKAKYMDIEAHSTKKDIWEWNRKLWDTNKKIETKIDDNGNMFLKVTKRHNYK